MTVLDKLIKEGWWKDKGEAAELDIDITTDELERLKRGEEIIKQDQEGAFIRITIPTGKSNPEDIQIERLPIAAEGGKQIDN
jgi:hypothetical protein